MTATTAHHSIFFAHHSHHSEHHLSQTPQHTTDSTPQRTIQKSHLHHAPQRTTVRPCLHHSPQRTTFMQHCAPRASSPDPETPDAPGVLVLKAEAAAHCGYLAPLVQVKKQNHYGCWSVSQLTVGHLCIDS